MNIRDTNTVAKKYLTYYIYIYLYFEFITWAKEVGTGFNS
jgi:hypothetical protein